MDLSILEIGTKITTPIGISGFIITILYLLYRLLIRGRLLSRIAPAHTFKVINRLTTFIFILSIVGMVLGFIGYIVDKSPLVSSRKIVDTVDIHGVIYVDGIPAKKVKVYLLETDLRDNLRILEERDKGQFEFKDVRGVKDEVRFSVKLPGDKEKVVF